jgi:hypothetical protein
MRRRRGPLRGCVAAAILATGCAHTVGGTPLMPATEGARYGTTDVDEVLLTTPELREITGAGSDMTAVPGMDSKKTVDDENLVESAPPECRFVFRESVIFGPDVEQFHKTSFQTPPQSALMSEAAAAYLNADAARRAYNNVANMVVTCGNSVFASTFVGQWTANQQNLHTRTAGSCGRIYRVEATVLIEVTYCGYAESVPEAVVKRLAAKVPPA